MLEETEPRPAYTAAQRFFKRYKEGLRVLSTDGSAYGVRP